MGKFFLCFLPLEVLDIKYYIFNDLEVKRNSPRCIFAKSVWIERERILEVPVHPPHHIRAELSRRQICISQQKLTENDSLLSQLQKHSYLAPPRQN